MFTREHQIYARPYQVEAVESLWQYFANGGTGNPLVAMPTGCHAKGHPILMHNGSIKVVEDVVIGDLLMGPDSKPRKVLSLARGREPMRKIVPTKGKAFVVNENHILSLRTTAQKNNPLFECHVGGVHETLTVKEYETKSNWFKHTRKLWRVAVDFPNRNETLICPYAMGVLIGDGSLKNQPAITTMDQEIEHVVYDLARVFNLTVRKQTKPNNKASSYIFGGYSGYSNPLTDVLRIDGLWGSTSESKFIPADYLLGDRSTRLHVLAGLIDTDGSATCNGYDFISKSKMLAKNVEFLCRSLGLAAYAKACKKKTQSGKEGVYWRVSISGDCDIVPVRLERKKLKPRKQKKNPLVTGFVVETMPINNFYGFALDGDHLYVDGEFIVHHNTGKSLIPPLIMHRAFSAFPNQRMAMLTHVKELVEQNRKALERVWPAAPVGIYSAGLDRKEAFAPIVFGSIQSANRSVKQLGWRDILFIDEAQLLSPSKSSMYQQTIAEMQEINPNMKVIGLTATPFRMGQGKLTDPTYDSEGNNRPPIFTDIVYDITGLRAFNKLIDDYYLSPLVPRPTSVVIDVSDVRELAGEFVQSDLAEAIKKQNITRQALAESWQIAYDRKSWIVFGSGIENCITITDILNEMGIGACCVHSKMKNEDRDGYIEAFKAGRFRAIVSNNILTTGFDHPQVDCIVDLRPTTSVVLHVQKYGRGTRPYFHPSYNFDMLRHADNRRDAMAMGGKNNCVVLDFAGNTNRLGPINDPRIPKKKGKGTGEVPVKICPECGAYNHTTARFCCDSNCNYEFIFKTKIKAEASTAEIIRRTDQEIEIVDVTSMNGYLHRKQGKTDKVRVQYFCNIQQFNVWLGFEPDEKGFVKHKSREWWRQHCGDECPQSTAEALERFNECRQTRQLKVDVSGEYPEIKEFLF